MSSPQRAPVVRHYIGYDPGGTNANGVALITQVDGTMTYETAIVTSVDSALEWFQHRLLGAHPSSIGIDTYLYWETGEKGWRAADRWLKRRYSRVEKSVFASNSAFGSMAVQGMAFAILARDHWPSAQLVEAHPKVLYYARSALKYDWPGEMHEWLLSEIGIGNGRDISTEHEWDALISAWAAREGSVGNWPLNLRALSVRAVEPAGSVAYWWPTV